MSLKELDSENGDFDLTSTVTVLTDTPDGSRDVLCYAVIYAGDGAKDLDGTGGTFELRVEIDGVGWDSPQQKSVAATVERTVWITNPFPVKAGEQVVLKVKSPNGADTDVDVTAKLYEAPVGNVNEISEDSTAADNLKAMLNGTGDVALTLNKLTIDADNVDGGLYIVNAGGPGVSTEGDDYGIYAAGGFNGIYADGVSDGIYATGNSAGINVSGGSDGIYAYGASGDGIVAEGMDDGMHLVGTAGEDLNADFNDIDGKSLQQALRYIAAVLAGKVSGAGTGTETFKGLDGSTDRVEVTVDAQGNRTGVSYDPP